MKIDHEKFTFVLDYLMGLGFDSETVLEAVGDKRIKRSYKIIMKNPDISREEFLAVMQFTDKYKEDFPSFRIDD